MRFVFTHQQKWCETPIEQCCDVCYTQHSDAQRPKHNCELIYTWVVYRYTQLWERTLKISRVLSLLQCTYTTIGTTNYIILRELQIFQCKNNSDSCKKLISGDMQWKQSVYSPQIEDNCVRRVIQSTVVNTKQNRRIFFNFIIWHEIRLITSDAISRKLSWEY